jgi:hypothetical protein
MADAIIPIPRINVRTFIFNLSLPPTYISANTFPVGKLRECAAVQRLTPYSA